MNNHNERRRMYVLMPVLWIILSLVLICNIFGDEMAQCPDGWEYLYTTHNLCYVGNEPSVTIPKEITQLDQFAFYGNSYVRSIVIPDTVLKIEDYSIYNAPNLHFIIFQGNPVIGKYGIAKCPRLQNISVNEKGSFAQQCADQNNIHVYAGNDAGFSKRIVYLLVGDTYSQSLCNSLCDVISWKSSRSSIVTVDGKGTIKAKATGKAVITAYTEEKAYAYSVVIYRKTVSNRIKQINKQERLSTLPRYEIIKEVHNWMIKNISYDYKNYRRGKIPNIDRTVKGALLRRKCVCQGYAVGFKKLMDALHIPCKYVYGKAGTGSHAWNMVKLNGAWYHIDVTWDDPISREDGVNTDIYYTYFLKSTKYMKEHRHSFNSKIFPKCTSTKYDCQTIY